MSKLACEKNQARILKLDLFKSITTISIHYTVMQRSKKIKKVSFKFEWFDVGFFESVYDYLIAIGHSVDENGNMVIGTDNYTAFVGVRDTIFVNTDTANLILKKELWQHVKSVNQALAYEK